MKTEKKRSRRDQADSGERRIRGQEIDKESEDIKEENKEEGEQEEVREKGVILGERKTRTVKLS